MDYTIRLETEKDDRQTENVTREAFWDVYHPGCVEHLIVHKLRTSEAFIKELDLVACIHDQVIGNIMYSKAAVVRDETTSFEVLCLGPVSVLPEYQGKGIGGALINESIRLAKHLPYPGVFLYGNPAYYPRFGFRNAEIFSIQTSAGENFDSFMGLELAEGSLRGISGRFIDSEVFKVEDAEVEDFEKQFPKKEKHVTPTQLR